MSFSKKTLYIFIFSPCSGLVVSGYSKTEIDSKLLTKVLAEVSKPYKKFKKMYSIARLQDYNSVMKLRFVRIYFEATTFNLVTKDDAAKFVDMLSAVGGTMGLLTGFSIISAMEIVYFASKIILQILKDRVHNIEK